VHKDLPLDGKIVFAGMENKMITANASLEIVTIAPLAVIVVASCFLVFFVVMFVRTQKKMGISVSKAITSSVSASASYRVCLKCNVKNSPNARFCKSCGADLNSPPANLACPKCGSSNPLSAKFCNNCGKVLK
jgi:ribosomal protein L40E